MKTELKMKQIEFSDFLKVDKRVGTVISDKLNERAIKPEFALKLILESWEQKTHRYKLPKITQRII